MSQDMRSGYKMVCLYLHAPVDSPSASVPSANLTALPNPAIVLYGTFDL